jgi:hypothetical protein
MKEVNSSGSGDSQVSGSRSQSGSQAASWARAFALFGLILVLVAPLLEVFGIRVVSTFYWVLMWTAGSILTKLGLNRFSQSSDAPVDGVTAGSPPESIIDQESLSQVDPGGIVEAPEREQADSTGISSCGKPFLTSILSMTPIPSCIIAVIVGIVLLVLTFSFQKNDAPQASKPPVTAKAPVEKPQPPPEPEPKPAAPEKPTCEEMQVFCHTMADIGSHIYTSTKKEQVQSKFGEPFHHCSYRSAGRIFNAYFWKCRRPDGSTGCFHYTVFPEGPNGASSRSSGYSWCDCSN